MKKLIAMSIAACCITGGVFAQQEGSKSAKPKEQNELAEGKTLRKSLEKKQLDAAPEKLGEDKSGNKHCSRKKKGNASRSKKNKE